MTIVDSINGVTSALGGDPKEANTIQEAIDTLTPVIVEKTSGGGGGSNAATVTVEFGDPLDEYAPPRIESVVFSNTTSFEDYLELEEVGFVEAVMYSHTATGVTEIPNTLTTSQATHSFYNAGDDGYVESITASYNAMTISSYNHEIEPIFGGVALYRIYADGEWGEWILQW